MVGVFILFFGVMAFLYPCAEGTSFNNRPVVGIIAQETSGKLSNYGSSYIGASYVKFLESAGARVVPILIKQPKEYYEDIFGKLNGILFPGGGPNLESFGYGRTGKIIFDLAVKANSEKDFFPLWGTCLGFELLNYLAANSTLWMKICSAEDLPSPILLKQDYKSSKMFQSLTEDQKTLMENSEVTINYHQWCLTERNYTLSGLDKYFRVLSLSQDSNNETYISIIEAFKYPFYGVAFHPEKNIFEWVKTSSHRNIPHSLAAVRTAQYFGNFFINEARKSNHKFPNKELEDAVVMYNYQPIYMGIKGSTFEQIYFFNGHALHLLSAYCYILVLALCLKTI